MQSTLLKQTQLEGSKYNIQRLQNPCYHLPDIISSITGAILSQ